MLLLRGGDFCELPPWVISMLSEHHGVHCANLGDSVVQSTPRLHSIAYCSVGEEKSFPSTLPGAQLSHPVNKSQLNRRKTK